MSNPSQAEYKIVREESGQYHVECKDKAVSWFYIVASHLGTGVDGLHNAVKYCEKHFEPKQPHFNLERLREIAKPQSEEEIGKAQERKKKRLKQPKWCIYDEKICWSLVTGKVTSEEYCKICNCYRYNQQYNENT